MKSKSSFKKILFLFLVICVSFIISACDNTERNKFKPMPINEILETATNNQEIQVEGIVYGVVDNGFYIYDNDDGKIFVIMGTDWDKDVKKGDKVQLDGKFGIFANMPHIKAITNKQVVSSDNELISAQDSEITEIMKLSNTDRKNSYFDVFKIVATIEENEAKNIVIKDDVDNQLLVNLDSNTAALRNKLNERVTLDIIVHEYNSVEKKWVVSFVGEQEDIINTPISFDDLKDAALADIETRVKTTISDNITLPLGHNSIEELTYKWTVEDNDIISIQEDGVVNVNFPEDDKELTLSVLISANGNGYQHEVKVLVPGIKTNTVKELLDNLPAENGRLVSVNGVVISIFRNQTKSLKTVLIKDPVSSETLSVDFSNEGDENSPNYGAVYNQSDVQIGDEIIVRGKLRITNRQTITDVSDIQITKKDVPFIHDLENAYEINDDASLLEFADNYNLYLNKLVKITNPYFGYSSKDIPSQTNWVRFGYEVNDPHSKHGNSDRHFALQIGTNDESLGSRKWRDMFNIPYIDETPVQFDGAFYAYPIYVSSSYITFVVPSLELWQFYGIENVEYDLRDAVPKSVEGDNINLPKEHPNIDGLISWSSSHPNVIDIETGAVKVVAENLTVTLTARFMFNDLEYTLDLDVLVVSSGSMSVSELLTEATDGEVVKVTGIFGSYHADGNSNVSNHGIILFDENNGKSVLVNNVQSLNDNSLYGAYLLDDGTLLEIGDKLEILATYKIVNNKNYLLIDDGAYVKKVSSGNSHTYDFDNAIVIDSNEAMTEFAADLKYGQLIKFVATEDNPIGVGGSSSTLPFNLKVYFNIDAKVNNDTKYESGNGMKTFVFKSDVNEKTAGEDWVNKYFGIAGPFVGPNSSQQTLLYTGEIYAMLSNETGSYFQLVFVNVDELNVTRIN